MYVQCSTCTKQEYCDKCVIDERALKYFDECVKNNFKWHRDKDKMEKKSTAKPKINENNNVLQDSGNRREFETGAVRDIQEGKGRFDLLPWDAIQDLAVHCERGAVKYGERNCEKGIPVSSLTDSAFRHLSKYVLGHDDEDHLIAAIWNLCMIRYMEKNKPEMQNIPARIK